MRLMKGSALRLIEKDGISFREAVDATFLHNNTYLVCDTALWNVDTKIINAYGHVQIIQEETTLTSDNLDYVIDDNLAKFRGGVVQLTDKSNNTLRTRYLDYNTRDSVAVFTRGGAFRDKDGQVIESDEGTYNSAAKLFTFRKDVNMFTDSVFVKTLEIDYHTDSNVADFKTRIDFWKDGNMLSADGGWYDRRRELFFFEGNVHALTEKQESWSDSLYFYRGTNDVILLGRAQVQDTTRNVAAVAGRIHYCDSVHRVTLTRDAAVAMRTEEKEKVDTVYFGADSLTYNAVRRCDVPENEVREAQERLADMSVDPVTEYRRKAAEEARKAAEEAAANDPGRQIANMKKKGSAPQAPAGTEEAAADTLAVSDSLAAVPEPDTTRIGFLLGRGRVKVFRKDIQVLADSLRYNDLDSIARFFTDPVVWNEEVRQYSADSLSILIRKSGMDRASLQSNAFILTQEDSLFFDQIKSTEVMAYFDTTSALRRFDALGGAVALFYLEENETIATANRVESKMLSAEFKDGELQRVFYFDNPKNDAYPVAQMKDEDRRMRGFNWRGSERPLSKEDITSLEVRPSERSYYFSKPRAVFVETDKYFPGYMESVYRGIAVRDSLKNLPPAPDAKPDTLSKHKVAEAVTVVPDSLATSGSPAMPDSLSVGDSLVVADSLSVKDTVDKYAGLSEKELQKLKKQEEKEARIAAKEAEKKAKWDALDARDAAKKAAKDARKTEKRRKKVLKELQRLDRLEARDNAVRQKFEDKFRKRKEKKEGKPIIEKPIIDDGNVVEQVPALRVSEHPVE